MCQPIKIGYQTVAKAIGSVKLLSKDNNLKSITVKYQQKVHDDYLMDNHDKKCM